jgi:glycosyltransferase involved in cell wall biosynthesis
MRILHVNKFLYRRGGAEAYMQDVAALQVAEGHDIAFFGMQHPLNPALEHAETFPDLVELDPPPGPITGKLEAAARMFHSPGARRGFDRILEVFRPDIVHLHNVYHQLPPSMLQPLVSHRVPSVMTLHDYKIVCPTYLFLDHGDVCEACLDGHFHHAVLRRCKNGSVLESALCALESSFHRATKAYAAVTLFVCPSRFLARKVIEARVFPDRVRHLNSFVDVEHIAPKAAPGTNAVFASRLSPEKGLDVLVEAVAKLGPGVHLDVAGEGPDRPRIEILADRIARGQVRFLGRLPKREVFELIAGAGVVVVPSRCYENQPLGVLEAFACGVPVVASNHGGIAELVDPGVDGVLVPPGDPGALASALRALLADPQACLRLGHAGREKVVRAFTPAIHLAGLHCLYQEAIDQGRAA